MALPPSSTALRALQTAFGEHLRRPGQPGTRPTEPALVADITGPEHVSSLDRLAVYRNNARYFFLTALERTYPVLRHRVGDDYFQRLAHDYRLAHPSRHGDLHWIGEAFPAWLEQAMAATEYRWLPDLARLEWACESAWGSCDGEAVTLDVLAGIAPEALEDVTMQLHPSVRLVASPYPIWSVWQANQGTTAGTSVDLSRGAEHCLVACPGDSVVVYRVTRDVFALLEQFELGAALRAAIDTVDYDVAELPQTLAWLFQERLILAANARPEPG